MKRSSRSETVRRTIRLTQMEAVPFALMTGLTDPFMIPYALALGASAFEAGLLSSVRNLILALSQLGVVRFIHWFRSRKRLILLSVGLQAAIWIPLAFASPLFGHWAVPVLVALFTVGSTAAAIAGPAWGSMVSEQLPRRRRGTYFGRREMLVGIGTALAGLAAGATLHAIGNPILGFGVLCGTAALCRFASLLLLRRLDERPWHEPPAARTRFIDFLARAKHDNFVRFTLCMGFFSLTVNLTVPYLTVWMLKELQFDYFTYSMVVLSGTMIGNLTIPRWGRIGDARGNRAVLRLTMAGAALLPFLWSMFPHPLWLLSMHVVGGLLWGGLNLSAVNFVYDASNPPVRARHLAYFNVVNGCSISLGAFLGGWLLGKLPAINGSSFLTLFIVAGSARCLAMAVFDGLVREVRPIRQIGVREVMHDFVGQRFIQVMGYFSVRPELERRLGRRRRTARSEEVDRGGSPPTPPPRANGSPP